MKTLGIFVGSDRHPDYLWALAAAAAEKDLNLHIHFFGSGVRLATEADFRRLPQSAQITICRASAARLPHADEHEARWRHWLVPHKQMARIIQACDRHLFI